MPDHLKLTGKQRQQKPSSMPPKTRIPRSEIDGTSETKSNTGIGEKDSDGAKRPKPLTIDNEVASAIRSRRRTGSTGGSSAKEAEIIGKEVRKDATSPSPSPLGHPQFPLNRSNNAIPRKNSKPQKKASNFTNFFKNASKTKKKKSHKGFPQSELSAGTPIGIGNVGPPPISIGFGLPRGRQKNAATAFDYENLNNSFQLDQFRHNTITTTPSHRIKSKRKGSKKVRVSCDLNQSLVMGSKGTPMSKKMMNIMNATINHQLADFGTKPVSALNKTIYATGLREQINPFPSIMFKKKFRVRSRGESPKNHPKIARNVYLAKMRGGQARIKSSCGYGNKKSKLSNLSNLV